LPKGLNVKFKSHLCAGAKDKCEYEDDPADTYVVITDGKLLHGTIDDEAVGPILRSYSR
jgi:hypothetical protein